MQNQDLAIWCAEAHRLAIGKGFWGKDPDAVIDEPNILAAKIALMHSELSELLEAIRENPDAPCGKNVNLTREEEEVADLFLRLADFCGQRGIDLGLVAMRKHEYNKTRPAMHGKRL